MLYLYKMYKLYKMLDVQSVLDVLVGCTIIRPFLLGVSCLLSAPVSSPFSASQLTLRFRFGFFMPSLALKMLNDKSDLSVIQAKVFVSNAKIPRINQLRVDFEISPPPPPPPPPSPQLCLAIKRTKFRINKQINLYRYLSGRVGGALVA